MGTKIGLNSLRVVFLGVMLLLTSCCFKRGPTPDEFYAVSVGMTTAELSALYGEPWDIREGEEPGQQEWVYIDRKQIGWKAQETTHLIFVVENGKVVSKEVCTFEQPVEVRRDRGDFTPD
jgi:hypothetical protein